jgi:hypothetical protein
MSLDFLTKPIGGSRKKDSETGDAAALGRSRTIHPESVARPGGGDLVVGGSPRVDLMPPEIRIKRSQLRTRRNLRLGLVGVVAVTLVACGGAFAWNAVTQASLGLAQIRQQQLLSQQNQFGEVTKTSSEIALIQAGQRVGASTEVQWGPYLDALQAAMPAGMALTNVSVESASPVKSFDQPVVPLQGGRIATIAIQVSSSGMPSAGDLLDNLSQLPGFADASPGTVSLAGDGYQTTITMHIGTAALSQRFAKTGE